MIRILNAEAKDYSDAGRRVLRDLGAVVEGELDRDHLLARLHDVDVLIVRLGHRVDRELLEAAPTLRAVVTATTGLDHIDLEAARERGVAAIAPLAEIVLENQDVAQLEKILPVLQALREFLDAERNAVDGID